VRTVQGSLSCYWSLQQENANWLDVCWKSKPSRADTELLQPQDDEANCGLNRKNNPSSEASSSRLADPLIPIFELGLLAAALDENDCHFLFSWLMTVSSLGSSEPANNPVWHCILRSFDHFRPALQAWFGFRLAAVSSEFRTRLRSRSWLAAGYWTISESWTVPDEWASASRLAKSVGMGNIQLEIDGFRKRNTLKIAVSLTRMSTNDLPLASSGNSETAGSGTGRKPSPSRRRRRRRRRRNRRGSRLTCFTNWPLHWF